MTGFAWRDGCLPASERSVWTRSVSDEVSTPDSAVKHGESKMVLLKPNHSRTYRVRIARAVSEKPAVSGHRKPMKAGWCWRRGGVSRRRQHERRRPRAGIGIREWRPCKLPRDSSLLSAANKFSIEQRELIFFQGKRASGCFHIQRDAQLHLVVCSLIFSKSVNKFWCQKM